jgi:hypothetical protein
VFEPFNKPENLDLLPKYYFLRQRARVRQVENRILQAPSQATPGRIPRLVAICRLAGAAASKLLFFS